MPASNSRVSGALNETNKDGNIVFEGKIDAFGTTYRGSSMPTVSKNDKLYHAFKAENENKATLTIAIFTASNFDDEAYARNRPYITGYMKADNVEIPIVGFLRRNTQDANGAYRFPKMKPNAEFISVTESTPRQNNG